MKQKTKKQATYWLKIAVIGIALGFALQFVRAWTEPTMDPPNGNVGAPINTSANPQTKEGGLLLGSTTTGGNKGSGTVNADRLCIRGDCRDEWPSGGAPTPTPTPTPTCPCGTCGDTGGGCPSYSGPCNWVENFVTTRCDPTGWVATGSVPCCMP